MAGNPNGRLRRNLTVWQAVGLSVALMAPSMAANINPQFTAQTVGRAVPLAFLFAAIGVLLVAYGFVRLCQYYQHSGSVYAFVGSTLGPRAGVVSGLALFATYVFYGVVTASATGILGTDFLDKVGIWDNPGKSGPFVLAAIALVGALALTIAPAKRGTSTLLLIEAATIALILLVCAVVLIRVIGNNAPDGGGQSFDLTVFSVPPGIGASTVFLGIVFGFLSFAGFEAASTLGEETANPGRDIPRAILGTAIFGGVYFVVVTAIEMMGFGTDDKGVKAFQSSGSLVGDLGHSYIAAWVGDLVSLGAAISAFGCCLACLVGASRLLFAMSRDMTDGNRGLAEVSGHGTPARAAWVVVGLMAAIIVISVAAFDADVNDTFGWSGTIGTLILLVAYVLTTIGAIRLVFVQHKIQVPQWEIVIPLAALVLLGYTLYRNVFPYPDSGPAQWFPVVAFGWILLAVIAVLAAPGTARRLGERLAADEGFRTEQSNRPSRLTDA
jgi:amino acid transporter